MFLLIHFSAANKMRLHSAVRFISGALVANFRPTNATEIVVELRITIIGRLSNIWGKFPSKRTVALEIFLIKMCIFLRV